MKKAIIFAIAVFLAAAVMADDIPDGELTTFTAGTPARASEVNANFDAVQAAVNDNDARLDAVEPLMPVAMGTVSDNGTLINGYGVVSTSYDAETRFYKILLTDGPYYFTEYVTIVTSTYPMRAFPYVMSMDGGGQLCMGVGFLLTSGNLNACSFTFVTYRIP